MIATGTVTFYNVIVFFHIAAVVVGFGPTFAYGMFQAIAARDGMRGSLTVTRATVAWNQTGLTVSMVIVFLSGMYLAAYESFWEFSDFFISWGFIAILALFGIVHGFFLPREKAVVAMLEEEVAKPGGSESTELPPEIAARYDQISKMGIAAGVLIILTIYVMTAKPFL